MPAILLVASGCGEDSTGPVSNIIFSEHVQPIFDANCNEMRCHNDTDAAAGLRLTSYERLSAGSNFGIVIVPFEPDRSYLYLRLTGVESPQMPLDRDPLQEDVIQLISRWIEEGARNDDGSVMYSKSYSPLHPRSESATERGQK